MTSIDLDKIVNKHFVFFVDEESPAFNVVRRIAKTPYKAGRMFPVSKEELKSLRKDLLAVQVKEDD